MGEVTGQIRDIGTAHKRKKRFAPAAIALSLLIAAAALVWSRMRLPSAEERLAAMEAARTIPDSENAAIFYNRLMADVNAMSFDLHPAFLDKISGNLTLRRPWSMLEHPELADWIEQRRWLIDELTTVLQFERCRFPISIDLCASPALEHVWTMRKWAYVLVRAAGNDIEEGRIDAAITKWRCIIRMADHLYQQPTAIARLVGIGLEQLTMEQLAVYLIEGNVDEDQLKKIEELLPKDYDDWAAVLKMILAVEELAEEKAKEGMSLGDRLSFEFRVRKIVAASDPQQEQLHWLYTKTLALRRGAHILVALRSYRNEQGDWPAGLDEIRSEVPPQMLVDPFNNGGFVYKLTEDGFRLYSGGKNKMDEDGQFSGDPKKGPDDWPVWPPRGYRAQGETSKSK